MDIHVVRPGETVYSISRQYRVAASRVAADNGLREPYALAVGQALVILHPEQVHTVALGETLSSISRIYGVPFMQLLRNNPALLEDPTLLYPGQTIVIRYPEPPLGPLVVNGYAYPAISQSLLRQALPFLTYLALFTHGITPQGGLVDLDDRLAIATARAYGVKPLMMLAAMDENGQFSNLLASQVLNNPTARQTLVGEVTRVIGEKGYEGVDMDFEFILPQDAEKYVTLVQELSAALNPLGYVVFVALAPKISSDQTGSLYEGHDYVGLGRAANAVLVMTYEWGYTYGPPMAVAPINKVRQVLDYAVTQIEPNKILMGIPNYGYDWTLPFIQSESRARSISNVEAVEIAIQYGVAIQFDELAQSPWFRYTDAQGRLHEVWFEDARSIRSKLMLPTEYGLKGVSYWNIMRPFPQNWQVLNALYKTTGTTGT